MNFSLQPGSQPATEPAPATRDLPPVERPTRRGPAGRKLPVLVGAAVVVTAGVVVASVPGLGKGLGGLFTSPNADIIRYKVGKGRLAITVVERGNLESSKNLDVQSKVEGNTTIIFILPEGKE